jgi:hypothetical protein
MWPWILTNLFTIKQTGALISQIYSGTNLYMFRAVPLPIIRSYPMYNWHRHVLFSYDDSLRVRKLSSYLSPRSSILVVLESCHQTGMTYTNAECIVENSWWWAEELPETYRVSWQNKFGKLVRLLILLKKRYFCHFIVRRYINCITYCDISAPVEASVSGRICTQKVSCNWKGGGAHIRILPWYVRVISRSDRRFSYFDHDGVVLPVVAAHRTMSSKISWCFPATGIQGVYCADG